MEDYYVVGYHIDVKINDINFMLKDADLLVTDYSGAYFDFLLTEKPPIFAAFRFGRI